MNPTVQELLREYPHHCQITVQWCDMDANQHVNNAVYPSWSEHARIQYFIRMEQEMAPGITLTPILGELTCKYIFPATFPDTIWMGTRSYQFLADRFLMETLMVSQRHERVVARVRATLVNYDYTHLVKAPLPEGLEAALLAFEERLG
ncbi:MAG: thioesterase family protein [Bacteroidia bacterium]|nr:thioesterase family protein [Bacteroidia bacterium]